MILVRFPTRGRGFSFCKELIPDIRVHPAYYSMGGSFSGCEADQSHPSNAEVKE
jgi:hypothetical protein